MARHGENIRKRRDGRWEGRYALYDMEREAKRYHSVYGRTYDEVKEKLTIRKKDQRISKLKRKGGHGVPDPYKALSDSLAFQDAAESWLLDIQEKRKQSTYVKYRFIYETHLKIPFQNICLSDLTEKVVRENVSEVLSVSLQKSVYCVINQILKFAARQQSIQLPCIKRPDTNISKKPVDVFTRSEQKYLFFVLYTEINIFKMAILLCLYTGLRLGEVCALKWSDINFENKILTVSRTVQRLYANGHDTKTVLVETVPKSEYSKREIPLSTIIIELLIRFRNGSEYILRNDKAMEPRTLQYQFKKILMEAGLADRNFHTLRHTFATNCIDGGADVKSLSEILGHSDVQITLNRYVHPSIETKRKYMDGLSTFYGQIYGTAI